MTAREPTATKLYLGVEAIAASASPALGIETVRVTVPSRFDGRPAETTAIRFSPSVIAELEQLIEDFDLDLVWLSPWIDTRAVPRLTDALGTLVGGRVLPMPLGRMSGGYRHNWKAQALIRDLRQHPADFIWVDSGAWHQWKEARNTLPVRSCLVDGLTSDDVTVVREFLEQGAA